MAYLAVAAVILLLLLLLSPSKPDSVVLPVFRDTPSGLHFLQLLIGAPTEAVTLLVDLNGPVLWTSCQENQTALIFPSCRSTACSSAGIRHSCRKCAYAGECRRPNTCAVVSENPITRTNSVSELAQDVIRVDRNSSSRGPAEIRYFLLACTPATVSVEPLPPEVKGVAGLGYTPIALPTQIASRFGFPPEFSVCLSSLYGSGEGRVIIGRTPSQKSFVYAPLTIGTRGDYNLRVESIKQAPKNSPPLLLSSIFIIQVNYEEVSPGAGPWLAKFSTTSPYTVINQPLYDSIIESFARALTGVPRVPSISPFELCFDARILPPTRVGSPDMDLIINGGRNVTWRILGVQALLRLRPDVACLAFIDGGLPQPRSETTASITIGLNEIEERLLQFDLRRSRVGFAPSILSQPFRCS
ncbi:hypothetical protein M569_10034, partial [Genlisea aurea]